MNQQTDMLNQEPEPRTIQARFERFHAKHPEVYHLLVKFARQVRLGGRKQYGIAALFERVRWHQYVELNMSDEQFKLSNNYRSRYSRLIMANEPDLAGFFNVRDLRTK